MNWCSSWIWVCTVTLIMRNAACYAQENAFITSWQDLEKKLASEVDHSSAVRSGFDPFSWKSVQCLTTAQQVEELGLAAWLELLGTAPDTLLQHVAYHCIAENAPSYTTEAAFSILVASDQPAAMFDLSPAGSYLRGLESTEANLQALSVVLGKVSIEKRNRIAFILSELPRPLLESWITERRRIVVPTSYEAVVVNILLTHDSTPQTSLHGKLEKKTLKYARLPGVPRFVFLLHAEKESDLIIPAVKGAVVDESITDAELETALRVHKNRLMEKRESILEASQSVPRRAALIERILSAPPC